jgi:hypothetical protein
MNRPDINRSILRMHIAAIEAKHPIKMIGLLPRGSAGHVFDDNALDFLAEKRPGLDLWGLCEAEGDLADKLGRPVGIVLVSGLRDREAEEFPKIAEPICVDRPPIACEILSVQLNLPASMLAVLMPRHWRNCTVHEMPHFFALQSSARLYRICRPMFRRLLRKFLGIELRGCEITSSMPIGRST